MPKVTSVAQQQAALLKSKGYTADMILELTNAIAALEEKAVSFTIPTTDWRTNSSASYPYYYDIFAMGITAKDRVEITVAPDSIGTVIDCGLCPSNETLTDTVRVRATSKPTKSIKVELWVSNEVEIFIDTDI